MAIIDNKDYLQNIVILENNDKNKIVCEEMIEIMGE